jgi:phosphoribosylaminoimidazole-succinocarboxamide synthase
MSSTTSALLQTELPGLDLVRRGKVRDVYDVGEHFLIVATDRISAFDVVLPNGIPEKGKVLTRLSMYWFETLGVEHHLVTSDLKEMPAQLHAFSDQLEGRSMLVQKLKIMPVECVVRGYLAGSGWKEYQKVQSVCGVELPEGLVLSSRLPEPTYTPTTKADGGHDMPMTFQETVEELGSEKAEALRDLSLDIYSRAADVAEDRGIILCDTKFEFGLAPDGEIILADEVLTPDSSRFWNRATYEPGKSQDSYDKQFVRDYLETLDWNKQDPGPELPDEVVEGTAQRYREIFELITGDPWE